MAQKLITAAIQKQLPALYATEETELEDKQLICKFFTPWTYWTWYAIEYDPQEKLFFGYVQGLEHEWGYFSLNELESIQGPAGLRIERDIHFKPIKFSEVAS